MDKVTFFESLSESLGIEFVTDSEVTGTFHFFDEKVPCPFAGQKHTEESKLLISSALKGREYTHESIERMRQAKLGKKASEETRHKMSAGRKGENNAFYGKKHSDKTIEKIKVKCRDLVPPNKGVKGLYSHSDESKKKISTSLIGRKHSDETIAKMKEARKMYWDKRRGLTNGA